MQICYNVFPNFKKKRYICKLKDSIASAEVRFFSVKRISGHRAGAWFKPKINKQNNNKTKCRTKGLSAPLQSCWY